ncbi:relaxase/mobilization nuclease domain-containing protein [Hyphomicrobium sp. NDB2Meth4]|uniref:relaxase/mobilization nuclease domain-containing protein n=1 Tax=Hyphomicrobium sp. NDB2Meth4 TaxID=1892846 RepID=UPI00093036BB|nr:relaxase/mobilization nuclease domain-containing protein [Hyphomicrobium sp. NDB2Meth4]
MILKGAQRGGGKQLALHLLNSRDNEHIEVHEIRGFASDDIVGALKEAHGMSRGTKCRQFLFSVSLNPPPQERVPVETFESAIEWVEEKNGLKGQPRIVVFHEKEGRRHAHAVWSRIDADTMTAKNLPFFKTKLRDLSRELYIENGWKMPRGLMNSREADPRNFTLAEWHQAKRAGRDARDLKSMMQECWAVSDSMAAFMQALKSRGFTLARGDRRGHVALSPEGEVFSVARAVGKKTKDIAKRLGEPDKLPGVAEARAQLAKDLAGTFQRHRAEAELQKRRDLAPLDHKRKEMVLAHRQERQRLDAGQQQRRQDESKARAARFDTGVRGLWARVSGKHAAVQKQNEREAYLALARDRDQRQALIDAQMSDRQRLQADIKDVRDRHAALLRELRTDQSQIKRTLEAPPVMKEFEAQARPASKRAEAARSSRPKAQQEREMPKAPERAKDGSSTPARAPLQQEAPEQPRQPSMEQRLDRLRNGDRTPPPARNRDIDRER